MARVVRVASAQLGPAPTEKEPLIERIVKLVEQASTMGVEVIGFPELSLSPYFPATKPLDWQRWLYDEMPSPLTQPIFDAAKAAGMVLELGYPERDGDTCFIAAIIADSDGTILGKYRKVHITSGEANYFEMGNLGFPVFDTTKGKIGVQICRDRRFPEGYRCLAVEGAELVITGYNSGFRPGGRGMGNRTLQEAIDTSDLCMRTAAYQNNMWVLSVAKAGIEAGIPYLGASSIIDPSGTIALRARTDDDELIVGDIDLDVVAEMRTASRFLSQRSVSQFGPLVREKVPVGSR